MLSISGSRLYLRKQNSDKFAMLYIELIRRLGLYKHVTQKGRIGED
jgi:hypothetical protein